MANEIKEQLVEKTMKDMLETFSGVEKYVLVEKIVDLQQRIDKTLNFIKKQKSWWEEWHYDMCGVDDDIEEIIKILKGEE